MYGALIKKNTSDILVHAYMCMYNYTCTVQTGFHWLHSCLMSCLVVLICMVGTGLQGECPQEDSTELVSTEAPSQEKL